MKSKWLHVVGRELPNGVVHCIKIRCISCLSYTNYTFLKYIVNAEVPVSVYYFDKYMFIQLAEKLQFEDAEVLDQMKELITELGPGMLLFTFYIN